MHALVYHCFIAAGGSTPSSVAESTGDDIAGEQNSDMYTCTYNCQLHASICGIAPVSPCSTPFLSPFSILQWNCRSLFSNRTDGLFTTWFFFLNLLAAHSILGLCETCTLWEDCRVPPSPFPRTHKYFFSHKSHFTGGVCLCIAVPFLPYSTPTQFVLCLKVVYYFSQGTHILDLWISSYAILKQALHLHLGY